MKHRENRGLTSAGRKARGMLASGAGDNKVLDVIDVMT